MKLLILKDGVPSLYSLTQLARDNPQVSFPNPPPREVLALYGVYPFTETPDPLFDEQVERLGDKTFVQKGDGVWELGRPVLQMTLVEQAQAKAERQAKVEVLRLELYKDVADPVFFRWQAGQATREEWLAARDFVRDMHPDVD